MQFVVCIFAIIFIEIIFKIAFGIKIKNLKKYRENKRIEGITNKFPENIEIAKEMLILLNNKNVKIEQGKDTETSLYIAITNKIIIADMKNNYSRIQTIAHECLHSCQSKKLLLLNFIVSNINIIYFIIISILTGIGIIQNTILQLFILSLLIFTKIIIRSFLEIDAITKSHYLAKEYIESKKICNKEEKREITGEYSKINNIAILATIDNLLILELTKLMIFAIISLIAYYIY